MAEAVVTAGQRAGALDVTGIFIDSFRYAEPFRVARRPGSQLLEVAEDGMLVPGLQADLSRRVVRTTVKV